MAFSKLLLKHIAPRPEEKVSIIGKGIVKMPMPVSQVEGAFIDILLDANEALSTSQVQEAFRERGEIDNKSNVGVTARRLKEAGVEIESGKSGNGYKLRLS